MKSAYEEEQKSLQGDIKAYEESQTEQKKMDDEIDSFYALIDRYTTFEELTPKMLNEFVDKVLVHKGQKIDGERVQKVEVYLNFIGKIDFPKSEETPIDPEQAKIDQYWKDRYQRTKEREITYRKKKQETVGKRIEAEKEADRERIILGLREQENTIGLENIPVFPARLKNGAAAR